MPSPDFRKMTAFFGGTFDPPHLGHREAILGLFKAPGVGAVRILPNALPRWKTPGASIDHRLQMCELAFGDLVRTEAVSIDRLETDLPPDQVPRSTNESLDRILPQFPEAAFVIGTDQLAQLDQWVAFPNVLRRCHWIVLKRQTTDGQDTADTVARGALGAFASRGLLGSETTTSTGPAWPVTPSNDSSDSARFPRWLTLVPTAARATASEGIRAAIARTGRPPENSLNPQVAAYLTRCGLYGSSKGLTDA